MSFLFKRNNGFWYIRDKLKGRVIFNRSTGTRIQREAYKKLDEYEKDKERFKIKDIDLATLKNEVLDYLRVNNAPGTVEAYMIALNDLIRVIHNRLLIQITPRDIERFKKEMSEKVSKNTVNIRLKKIHASFNHAIRWKYLSVNPAHDIKSFRVIQKERLMYSREEIGKLLEITKQPAANAVRIALYTGAREGEILNLEWSDIDLSNDLLVIRNKPTFKTKTGKVRVIPINGELKEFLLSIDHNSSYVLGKKYSNIYLQHQFKKETSKRGITGLTFHNIRHTFLSLLANSGTPLHVVQQIAGHADLKTTSIYLHINTEDMRKAVQVIKY